MLRNLEEKIIKKTVDALQLLVSQAIKNRFLERSQGRLWGVLGCLGQSRRVLGASWARFGCVLERQRASWRHLGTILERLWGDLGTVLGGLGGFLGPF